LECSPATCSTEWMDVYKVAIALDSSHPMKNMRRWKGKKPSAWIVGVVFIRFKWVYRARRDI